MVVTVPSASAAAAIAAPMVFFGAVLLQPGFASEPVEVET